MLCKLFDPANLLICNPYQATHPFVSKGKDLVPSAASLKEFWNSIETASADRARGIFLESDVIVLKDGRRIVVHSAYEQGGEEGQKIMKTVRILVVDDHEVVRRGIRTCWMLSGDRKSLARRPPAAKL